MSFIETLTEKRRYFTSAVTLLETLDPLRFEELSDAKLLLRPKTPEWDFDRRLLWNLQTGQILEQKAQKNDKVWEPASDFAELNTTAEQKLGDILKDEATLLFMKWVFSKTDTASLSNTLLDWAQNKAIKARFSTVAVFTSSLAFFPSELLRWSIAIPIPASTEEEREQFLTEQASQIAKATETVGGRKPTIPPELVTATRGLTLFDLRNCCYESYGKHKTFKLETFSEYKVKNILAAYKIRYVEPTTTFNDVQGYAYLKNFFRKRILDPMINEAKYKAEGIEPPKGVLLYGPPGCGKTFISNAIGGESGLSVIQISPSDLMGSLVGETEARVRQITETIESLAPVVAFVDEADQLLYKRSGLNAQTDSGVTTRMVSGLLEYLGSKDRKAFVIAATNHLENIDKAFLRTGRLDKTVLLLYPDFASRVGMLKYYTNGITNTMTDQMYEDLASRTLLWNSADLSSLPVEAAMVRFEQGASALGYQHYIQAMERAFKVDIKARRDEVQHMIQTYTTYAPNYEPWLLEEAKREMSTKDKEITEALSQALA